MSPGTRCGRRERLDSAARHWRTRDEELSSIRYTHRIRELVRSKALPRDRFLLDLRNPRNALPDPVDSEIRERGLSRL